MRAFLQQPLITLTFAGRVFAPPRYGVMLALFGLIFFVQLGAWQLRRAAEKEVMQDRYAARTQEAPMSLPDILRQGEDVADFPVILQGHFDNAHTLFLDNQPQDQASGFHVYTPFLPEGDTRFVLVNRGWVARAQNAQLLPVIAPAHATEVRGTLAMPSAFFTVGQTDYRSRPLRVPRLEMDQLSRVRGIELRPFVVRLDAAAPEGFVRTWSPVVALAMGPEKHRAYAFQWFALAVSVLVMFVVVNFPKTGADSRE